MVCKCYATEQSQNCNTNKLTYPHVVLLSRNDWLDHGKLTGIWWVCTNYKTQIWLNDFAELFYRNTYLRHSCSNLSTFRYMWPTLCLELKSQSRWITQQAKCSPWSMVLRVTRSSYHGAQDHLSLHVMRGSIMQRLWSATSISSIASPLKIFGTSQNQSRWDYWMDPLHLDGKWSFIPLSDTTCRVEFFLHYTFSNILLDKLVGPLFFEYR